MPRRGPRTVDGHDADDVAHGELVRGEVARHLLDDVDTAVLFALRLRAVRAPVGPALHRELPLRARRVRHDEAKGAVAQEERQIGLHGDARQDCARLLDIRLREDFGGEDEGPAGVGRGGRACVHGGQRRGRGRVEAAAAAGHALRQVCVRLQKVRRVERCAAAAAVWPGHRRRMGGRAAGRARRAAAAEAVQMHARVWRGGVRGAVLQRGMLAAHTQQALLAHAAAPRCVCRRRRVEVRHAHGRVSR